MAHGAPDFYQYRRDSSSFPLADMAELAARLQVSPSFDRRGDFIFSDNFELGVGWTVDSVPVDVGTAELAVDPVYQGGFSVKLATETELAARTSILKVLMSYPTTRMGFEVFILQLGLGEAAVRIWNEVFNGTAWIVGAVRIDLLNETLEYYDSNGNWQVFATAAKLRGLLLGFMPVKLVTDAGTEKYVRFIFGSVEYDLSAFSLRNAAVPTPARNRVAVEVEALEAAGTLLYVDSTLVTVDEP